MRHSPGAGMLRGGSVLMNPAELQLCFADPNTLWPVFLRVCMQHLRDCGFATDSVRFAGRYRRHQGQHQGKLR